MVEKGNSGALKRILITGKASYIGTSFEKWLAKYPTKYHLDTICVKDDEWKTKDFSNYHVVFHVAGIAHVSADPKLEDVYFKVNRDLTIAVAKKAKTDGVKQFIFMSSIIVYGDCEWIDINTTPMPRDFYGQSKLEAEQGLLSLQDNSFDVAIIRSPMIYGQNSKGNYARLAKGAKILPIFPDLENRRSMLHIDNLCEFIRLMVDNGEQGLFFPQNEDHVKTSDMVRLISEAHGKEIKLTKVFNPILRPLVKRINLLNKVFGNLAYDLGMSKYKINYRNADLKESIYLSEIL